MSKLASLKQSLASLWKDERGAMTTVEIIGYSLLIGGAVALVGYGFTALGRGKTADLMSGVKAIKAMSGEVTETSGYGHTVTTDTDTGIATGATGN